MGITLGTLALAGHRARVRSSSPRKQSARAGNPGRLRGTTEDDDFGGPLAILAGPSDRKLGGGSPLGTTYERVRQVVLDRQQNGIFADSLSETARRARCSRRRTLDAIAALRADGDLVQLVPARQHRTAVYELGGSLARIARTRR